MMLLFVLLFTSSAFAATASWDAVSTPDLQGYRLYGAMGTCAAPGAFSLVTTYGVVTSGAVPTPFMTGTYCYRLTAFTASSESYPSNTAQWTWGAQCPSVAYCKTLKGQARRQCLACQ